VAYCKICGFRNKHLPDNWKNWDCSKCRLDEMLTCSKYYEARSHIQNCLDNLNGLKVRLDMEMALSEAEKQRQR